VEFVRIKAEDNESQIRVNDGPACAGSLPAAFTGRSPDAVDKRPLKQGRDDFPDQEKRRNGKYRIKPAFEQIVSNPPDYAHTGHRWFECFNMKL
jgi:hypothetical protein